MNQKISNFFFWARDKFMPEMDLRQSGFTYSGIVLVDHLLKKKTEFKNLKKQEIQGSRFLLCVIDFYSEYTGVVPLRDKKGIAVPKTC